MHLMRINSPSRRAFGAPQDDGEFRNAKNKETITVLDGQTLELTSEDCVITDGKKADSIGRYYGW